MIGFKQELSTANMADAPQSDLYRRAEKELRNVKSIEELYKLDESSSVTRVIGCGHDDNLSALLAEDGAAILRNFVQRSIDQLAICALALRPLNVLPTDDALSRLRTVSCKDTHTDACGLPAIRPQVQKKLSKCMEEIKSSSKILADSPVTVQTNFSSELASYPSDDRITCSQSKKRKRPESFPLSRLRYLNLGEWNYNWGDRRYEKVPHAIALADRFVEVARRAHELAKEQTGEAASRPVNFDMAICNLYHLQRPSDRLGGHRDDVEEDLSLPLVTISLGAPGVFLLGGESRQDAPTAILLRAGDCMVMSGRSRKYFHGVPTVLSLDGNSACQMNGNPGDKVCCVFPELDDGGCLAKGFTGDKSTIPSLDEMEFAQAFLTTVRMNLSIRQVA